MRGTAYEFVEVLLPFWCQEIFAVLEKTNVFDYLSIHLIFFGVPACFAA
jgi:hypothetical protein